MEHKLLTGEAMHVPHRWKFANEAQRLISSVTDADIDKLALQVSDDTYWRLSSINPVKWVLMSGLDGAAGVDGDKGAPGQDGRSFQVDATGMLSDRIDYDSETVGFSFLATDTGNLYIRQGAEWSDPIAFGKGEKGDSGKDGEGVPSGGLSGQILRKKNIGNEGAEWHTLTKDDLALNNVDNTADVDKSISIATQLALDEKADSDIVNSALAKKASLVDVDALLMNKADLVNGQIPLSQLPPQENIDSTDAVAEGDSNQYFTAVRVRETVLNGLSFLSDTVVSATDTVLGAFGKLQAQVHQLVTGKQDQIPEGTSKQYYRGDKLWQVLDKSAVDLSDVDNTSDLVKPISEATQIALNAKENTIPTGTTSQYIRGDKTLTTMNKAAVGLSNVDNVSDANKPVSTATQAALNTKLNATATAVDATKWAGASKTISTVAPTTAQGVDGDIWFEREV